MRSIQPPWRKGVEREGPQSDRVASADKSTTNSCLDKSTPTYWALFMAGLLLVRRAHRPCGRGAINGSSYCQRTSCIALAPSTSSRLQLQTATSQCRRRSGRTAVRPDLPLAKPASLSGSAGLASEPTSSSRRSLRRSAAARPAPEAGALDWGRGRTPAPGARRIRADNFVTLSWASAPVGILSASDSHRPFRHDAARSAGSPANSVSPWASASLDSHGSKAG
jgi:hypothetical protein